MRTLRRTPVSDDISRTRVEPFSDGVFAIVVTLLVFDIKSPNLGDPQSASHLAYGLAELAPTFVSWVISFTTVCVIWLNHCRLFDLIVRVDNTLFWLNANLLLWTSFLPFPTALMGDYSDNPLAVAFFGSAMLLASIAFILFRLHLQRHPELLREDVDLATFRAGTVSTSVLGPLAYVIGIGCAWVHEALSFAVYAGVVVYFVFPHAMRATRRESE
ncbi:DUF1211 domain-containing protein [Candidatus Poribacteria bacterium]|jgi:uncharacterized membrane protein|nr:DUF1211 domain-containing protein [Candidatus Poribacteria bacterium]MBT5533342.1 DUF1211 domain-containing protein [Candidatus Poribacteria bacterium]MBT5711393.1 DUF1211 domain-containing protein [Candidatus Poribacteria bacterium]MBT7099416.1 DUF1211 domain-containing protein [Candidatus Poribacteria bacterium]MBT7804278.1 DUF1211 domain-containing protein [Candidatus Poribacteria bacterium]